MSEQAVLEQLQTLTARVEGLTEGLAATQAKLKPLGELGEDLGRLGKDLFETAVVELDPVAAHFTYEDLLFLAQKLLRNTRNLTRLLEYLEAGLDLLRDGLPLGNEAFIDLLHLLDQLERQGYFAFAKELLRVAEEVMPRFSPGELHRLGNHMITVALALKQMSDPSELARLEKAGFWRAIKEGRRRETREGLAFLARFLYLAHPGRGNEARGDPESYHRRDSK